MILTGIGPQQSAIHYLRCYTATAVWEFVEFGSFDGAGGQNRTGYARLFRAALYQ
jgi:hypothetical protein